MGTSKKRKFSVFLALAAFVVLLAAAWLLFGVFLNNPIKQAEADLNSFFQLLRNERLYDAYDQCAARLKEVSFEGFEHSILKHGLEKASPPQWQAGHTSGTEATFAAAMALDGELKDDITVKLVRERGRWRVYSIVSSRAGNLISEFSGVRLDSPEKVKDEQVVLTVPGDEELQRLVNQTLMSFNEAIQIDYFGPFYQVISNAWQQQTTPNALREAFEAFVNNKVSFASLRGARAEFPLPPVIDNYGILLAEGYYQESNRRINFRLRYVNEGGAWKLFGIDLSLVDQSQGGG